MQQKPLPSSEGDQLCENKKKRKRRMVVKIRNLLEHENIQRHWDWVGLHGVAWECGRLDCMRTQSRRQVRSVQINTEAGFRLNRCW